MEKVSKKRPSQQSEVTSTFDTTRKKQKESDTEKVAVNFSYFIQIFITFDIGKIYCFNCVLYSFIVYL